MYDELIKQLRDNAEFLVKASSGCLSNSFADTMCQAADAIEQLSNAGSAYGRGWTLGYDVGREESKLVDG